MAAKPTPTPQDQARVLRSLADRLEREETSLPSHLLEELVMFDDDPRILAELGLDAYVAGLPADAPHAIVDPNAGTAVRWTAAGWSRGSMFRAARSFSST